MLAWAECRHASWLFAAGEGERAYGSLAAAFARLRAMAGTGRRRIWRPVVAGGKHGLRAVRSSRRCG